MESPPNGLLGSGFGGLQGPELAAPQHRPAPAAASPPPPGFGAPWSASPPPQQAPPPPAPPPPPPPPQAPAMAPPPSPEASDSGGFYGGMGSSLAPASFFQGFSSSGGGGGGGVSPHGPFGGPFSAAPPPQISLPQQPPPQQPPPPPQTRRSPVSPQLQPQQHQPPAAAAAFLQQRNSYNHHQPLLKPSPWSNHQSSGWSTGNMSWGSVHGRDHRRTGNTGIPGTISQISPLKKPFSGNVIAPPKFTRSAPSLTPKSWIEDNVFRADSNSNTLLPLQVRMKAKAGWETGPSTECLSPSPSLLRRGFLIRRGEENNSKLVPMRSSSRTAWAGLTAPHLGSSLFREGRPSWARGHRAHDDLAELVTALSGRFYGRLIAVSQSRLQRHASFPRGSHDYCHVPGRGDVRDEEGELERGVHARAVEGGEKPVLPGTGVLPELLE
ncbi:cytoplasmic polyadenylation element-binding protein 2-like [Sphaerodactylus townsendi]|uniref:cytoplasmic polyadenylation element-binding protein 2-like n=1 Tax=Sphaerodactylus townsendi TaxID=933632 RepID=UPI002025E614|nr:cytoplasmic polyadenylation element-binding protein 2-like [Sphaerodactylus townsendi]